jgi:hypothetical protein
VDDEPQRSRGGDPRILLPQRARGGIAGIREGRLALLHHRCVDIGEAGDREVDLAADLEPLRQVVPVELLRDVGHRAHVGRDVLPRRPVAAGGRAHQPSALVQQRDRQAVDLELAQVARAGATLALDPLGPGGQLVAGERVVQALHPLQVVDRREGGGEAAVDLLAGRVRRDQRRMRGLDRLELAHQLVVLAVADQRLVADVIGEGEAVELLGEVAVPAARVVGDLGDVLAVGRRLDGGLVRRLVRRRQVDGCGAHAWHGIRRVGHRTGRSP